MSAFFGSTLHSAKSSPRSQRRSSVLCLAHDSPPSSDRYKPPPLVASTQAYIRFGLLAATQKPMRPNPSETDGSPFSNFTQVVPPSVDLKRPLWGPSHWPFSQGPCLPAQRSA